MSFVRQPSKQFESHKPRKTFGAGKKKESKLDLSQMNITDTRLGDCFDHIRKNRHLRSLNLSHNKISFAGFESLLQFINKYPLLEVLYLNNNLLRCPKIGTIKIRNWDAWTWIKKCIYTVVIVWFVNGIIQVATNTRRVKHR